MSINAGLSPIFNGQTHAVGGLPAVGYTVKVYLTGTTTPATTYKDKLGAAAHTWPIVLNALGEPPAAVWLEYGNSYDFELYDTTSTLVQAFANVPAINDVSTSGVSSIWDDTGIVNALAITPTPSITAYVTGLKYYVRVAVTNTTAATIAVSGLPATNLVRAGSMALRPSEIQAGEIIEVIYDGTQFQLLRTAKTLTGDTGFTGLRATSTGSPLNLSLYCDTVTLRTADGFLYTVASGTTITNTPSGGGPIVNGGDQAGAFSGGTDVSFYYIWNGTTLATIASANSTAPTLPDGYFAYALAYTIDLTLLGDGVTCRGNWTFYTLGQVALNGGSSTTEATFVPANYMPSNTAQFTASLNYVVTTSASAPSSAVRIRLVTGVNYLSLLINNPSATGTFRQSTECMLPYISPMIYVHDTTTGTSTRLLYITITGYSIRNGAR